MPKTVNVMINTETYTYYRLAFALHFTTIQIVRELELFIQKCNLVKIKWKTTKLRTKLGKNSRENLLQLVLLSMELLFCQGIYYFPNLQSIKTDKLQKFLLSKSYFSFPKECFILSNPDSKVQFHDPFLIVRLHLVVKS